MAWFLRVVELDDGGWACRFGSRQYDVHTDLEHAVEHITELAAANGPAQLFVHRLDGTVEIAGQA